MKKITVTILFAICSMVAMSQSQAGYVYNVWDSTTYSYFIDSTKTYTQAWPKNSLQINRVAGKYQWKSLSVSPTYGGSYVAFWDTTNIYILAPTIDSGYRKLRNIVFK